MAPKIFFEDKELQRMVDLLEEVDPETKKNKHTKTSIAKLFGISIAKLNKEVQLYKEKTKKTQSRKDKIKGTPVTKEEVDYFIELYTGAEKLSIAAIAKETLRSPTAIRNHLIKANIPIRTNKKSTTNKAISGDKTSELKIGDKIFSYQYNLFGEVVSHLGNNFSVWLTDMDNTGIKKQFRAYRPRSDLAKI